MPCIQAKTDLIAYLRPEWTAFWALSTDRPVGMAQGAIPWTSIDRYAARYGISNDEFDRFHDLIRALDAAFLSYKKDI